MHSKINATTVVTGSFNFTKAAEEESAGNVVIIRDLEVGKKFVRNIWEQQGHAKATEVR